MLLVAPPFIAPTSAIPLEFAFTATGVPDGSSAIACGTAHADRRLFVRLSALRAGAITLSSATIGGVAATIHLQRTHEHSSYQTVHAIISAPVPTGTTAIIAPTWSAAPQANSRACSIFRCVGLQSTTPVGSTNMDLSSEVDFNASWDVQAGGFSLCSLVTAGTASHTYDSAQMTTSAIADAPNVVRTHHPSL